MRIPKFNAWIPSRSEMSEVYIMTWDDTGAHVITQSKWSGYIVWNRSLLHDNNALLIPYIDLNDWYHNHIYEYDILSGEVKTPSYQFPLSASFAVEWDNETKKFILRCISNIPDTHTLYPNINKCSIIGNIFQNTQLLSTDVKEYYGL